jgi:hypothetical protein
MIKFINLLSIVLLGICYYVAVNSDNVWFLEVSKALPVFILLNMLRINSTKLVEEVKIRIKS